MLFAVAMGSVLRSEVPSSRSSYWLNATPQSKKEIHAEIMVCKNKDHIKPEWCVGGSSVSEVTSWTSGVRIQEEKGISIFDTKPRQVLGSIHRPIKWVPGNLFGGRVCSVEVYTAWSFYNCVPYPAPSRAGVKDRFEQDSRRRLLRRDAVMWCVSRETLKILV